MTVTVAHSTPADGTFSASGATAWNANHTLTGVGTMAEQDANNVNITGGSITGITIGTATNIAGGTTNQLLYQTGAGATSFITAPTIAGTYLNWSGSAFQWSANPLGDVVGPASATDNAVARFDTTTGKLIQNSLVTVSDTGAVSGLISETFTPVTAPAYAEGRVFYDTDAKTLCYYNDNTQMTVNIAQEQIVRVRNQTGADILNGTVVYVNGATGNTPTIALAIATSFTTADIIGVTTTSIANNGFGYATINGLVNGLDTKDFSDGAPVFLSATTPGAYTATEPTKPNWAVQVGVILRTSPSVGTLLVAVQIISTDTDNLIGPIGAGTF